MKAKNVGAALRRDVYYVGSAMVAVVIAAFAALAIAAALYDLLPRY